MSLAITRRAWLRLAALLTVGAGARPRFARAQGYLANLAPEEPIAATMKRLFGGRPIKDGAAAMTVEMPLIAEDGGSVPISVEVKSPMTPEQHVRAIYILSEKNLRPLNVKINLTPAAGQAYVATNLRLTDSGPVRAVAEMSDGSLLMVARDVRVTVAGCAA
ncbi:MAG TPA: thiosulfate oxidation carrier protein SoxY [Methylomirabilota bacterium]|nr:thiosulfate oxidation carrier protein SoxY [Methylomirabilota bacterium]